MSQRSAPIGAPAPRNKLLALWALVLLLLASVATTWLLSPESPSRTFRSLAQGSLLLWILVLALPFLRRPIGAAFRRWLRPINLIAINALSTLILAEVSLRVASHFSSSRFLAPISRPARTLAYWRGKPREPFLDGQLNSLGFLDREFELERKPGVRRVVALADSFGLGIVPYEENFLTLLEQQLSESQPSEVLNFGVVAISPREYLHLYRSEARHYEPDLVLMCFFVGNDFDFRKEQSLLHADSLMTVTVAKRVLTSARSEEARVALDPNTKNSFAEAAFLRLEGDRAQYCDPSSSHTQRKFRETLDVLEEISTTVGDRLRIAIVPDEYQVNDALWEAIGAAANPGLERELPQQILTEFLSERGIPYLDLLPAMRAAEAQGATYEPRDTHWNARGNRIAAEELSAWLF